MRSTAKVVAFAAALASGNPGGAHAQVRARADVDCRPRAEKLQYDCVIKLANARTKEPLSGLTLTIGADMPSMPGAHSVRPVVATEDGREGVYRALVALEMHGDWALHLNLSGAIRDRIVKMLRFEPGRVGEAMSPRKPTPHRH